RRHTRFSRDWSSDVCSSDLEDTLFVACIAVSEATLDAGVATVRLAVLVRHHAHQLVATHFRLERAADAAIGAGRDNGTLRDANRSEERRVGKDKPASATQNK